MKKFLLIACGLVLFMGCDNTVEKFHANKEISVSTQSWYYDVNELIVVTVVNNTEETVVLYGCNSDVFYYRDKLTDEGWEQWTQLSCGALGVLTGVELRSQSIVVDTINVRKPGTYRFRIPVMKNGDPNQMEMIYSNAFTIE